VSVHPPQGPVWFLNCCDSNCSRQMVSFANNPPLGPVSPSLPLLVLLLSDLAPQVSKHSRYRSARLNPCRSPVCELGQQHINKQQQTQRRCDMKIGRERTSKLPKAVDPIVIADALSSWISTRAASGDAITIGSGRMDETAAERAVRTMDGVDN
jgi:hypothetical protein